MISKTISLDTLLEKLEQQKHIDAIQSNDIRSAIIKTPAHSEEPIYIRILFGIGAWISTIFILIFLGISGLLDTDAINIVSGAIFLAAAIWIQRSSDGPFLSQLSLALAFTGNIMVLFGIMEFFRFNNPLPAVLAQGVICCIMYPLFHNSVYRFLSPLGVVFLIWLWIFSEKFFLTIHIFIGLQMLTAGYLLLFRKPSATLTPLIYASILMLPGSLLFITLSQVPDFHIPLSEPLWPSSIMLGIGLIYLLIHLAGEKEKWDKPWLIPAIIGTVLLSFITTPGILVAIALMIIGYAHDDRIISMLSFLFLACFLILFYYALNIDLAHKSWIMAGSGAILLILRKYVDKLMTGEKR